MMRVALGLMVLSLLLAAGPPARVTVGAETDAAAFDASWSQAALWDDGQAEVGLYEARRPQYGKLRRFEALLIVVKEDFNPKLHVKADPPYAGKALLPVLKLNFVQSYWTENYPYHFLTSVFVRRDDPTRLVKLTTSSQEWCGNTFKEVKAWRRPAELVFHSYFDGEGDGVRQLDLRPGDLLEDQLPLALRGLRFAPGVRVRTRLYPSIVSNSLRMPLAFRAAEIRVVGEEVVRTPRGRAQAWRVEVEAGKLKQTYWFASAEPHELLKMESSDGRELVLKQLTRKPYWGVPTYIPDDVRPRRGLGRSRPK
ncbi:MAG: hypothetical protein ACE5H2_05040 [Terriglobia bacterium]